MLTSIFWAFFSTGTLFASVVAFLYSRKGIHPRFRPNRGIVAMVFVILMVGNVFISLFAAKVVGPPEPALAPLRERKLPKNTDAPEPKNIPTPESAPADVKAIDSSSLPKEP